MPTPDFNGNAGSVSTVPRTISTAIQNRDLDAYKIALSEYLNVEGIDENGNSSLDYDLDIIARDCSIYFAHEEDALEVVMAYLKAMANSEELYKRLDTAHSKAIGMISFPNDDFGYDDNDL
ncbi:MAG: hypothetical protein GC137_09840 [Alphaproteobacteria bacterium]|nr:hypothetical protein [Alphaproteobacteria bacterium]